MEKRIWANVCRACAAIVMLLLAGVTTRAQLVNLLTNGGFEANSDTGGGTQTAPGWTFYNNAYVAATNETGVPYTPVPLLAHSGAYSLNTYNANVACTLGVPGCPPGSLGTQLITNITPGVVYKFCGFVLNWDGAPMFTPTGVIGFAEAQMQFVDSTFTNTITNLTTAAYGMTAPLPLDQWQAFEVTGTAPANAAGIAVYCLYVGMPGASGSAWWDDVSVFQMTGTTNIVAATSQPGVQVSYSTPPNSYLQVQAEGGLTPAAWTNFGPQTQGLGITNQISDVIGTSKSKFYKVIQTQ